MIVSRCDGKCHGRLAMLSLIDFIIVGHDLLCCHIAIAIAVAVAIATTIRIAIAVAVAVATALICGRGRGRCGIVWHILIGIWYLIVRIDVQRRDYTGNCLSGHFAQFLRL